MKMALKKIYLSLIELYANRFSRLRALVGSHSQDKLIRKEELEAYILQKNWLQWPHPGAKGSPNPGAKGTRNLMQCPRAPDGIYSVSVSLSEYCVTWSS